MNDEGQHKEDSSELIWHHSSKRRSHLPTPHWHLFCKIVWFQNYSWINFRTEVVNLLCEIEVTRSWKVCTFILIFKKKISQSNNFSISLKSWRTVIVCTFLYNLANLICWNLRSNLFLKPDKISNVLFMVLSEKKYYLLELNFFCIITSNVTEFFNP